MTHLLRSVRAYCDRQALLPHDSTVVVAVSGGPDSLCLLHLLRELAPHYNLNLHVAHLDHQLRPESADDAAFVQQIANDWDIPITIARADIAALAREQHSGIEAAARSARLQFLTHTAITVGATAVALGHNADDQAETVVLRLLRGAGPSGLAAMRSQRPIDRDHPSIRLIRPLLNTPRAEIEAYCVTHRLTPRTDSTNSMPMYLRNSVRGYILPLLKTYNPRIVATLGTTARICAEEDDLLTDLADDAWKRIATIADATVWLDRAMFAALHPALQRRLVRRAMDQIEADAQIEARHIDLVLAAIAANRRRIQLPGRVWCDIRKRSLIVRKDQP